MAFVYNWLLGCMICSFIFIFIFNLTYIIPAFQIMRASIIHFLKVLLLFYFYFSFFCIFQHPISFPFWKVKSPFYLKYVVIINLRYVYLGLPRWLNGVSPLHRSCAMQLPVKVLHSICQQIWKTQQWPPDWKRSVFIPIPKKGNAKECSNYCTIALISYTSKVMLKILQARL